MRSQGNSSAIVYLDEVEVLVIHARIIDATGGSHGVRDTHLLKSAIERPKTEVFGKVLFESVFEKAAAYFDSIAHHHPFIDGNKRTSFALMVRFLELNNYSFDASNKEVETYVLEAVTGHYTLEDISLWLKKHSKRIK